uniref:Reverse transcriptase domain-containing protein n=1 Tax=Angiostrongylus cantonensis TaxID=6313 RepID=A0A0K0D7B3_ANGCA
LQLVRVPHMREIRGSPFYCDINIDVKRGVRQGDTVSPNMGANTDGRQLHHLRFGDDIVLITPNISQAEHMLGGFDEACGKIGLRLNLTRTMFMKNGLISFAPFTLNGTNISECSSYVYLGKLLLAFWFDPLLISHSIQVGMLCLGFAILKIAGKSARAAFHDLHRRRNPQAPPKQHAVFKDLCDDE